jgi:hypothetical protein
MRQAVAPNAVHDQGGEFKAEFLFLLVKQTGDCAPKLYEPCAPASEKTNAPSNLINQRFHNLRHQGLFLARNTLHIFVGCFLDLSFNTEISND